ncbi:ABC transporter substrate-binding protein [Cryobacterium tagatosivorans]|uniref:ABC transporter substrate-binding protein n=1 Tax=Cryobacterium tagatosivorans TaxID=1259199 RepID=A0A4R8UF26_9MICO|nr:ABC transporter substrate-binding protein [Cryobacterium tagatosivorans]TFB51071.1 ABC transporter substrate-binding protein [Cryobacterium tagatosivorans]
MRSAPSTRRRSTAGITVAVATAFALLTGCAAGVTGGGSTEPVEGGTLTVASNLDARMDVVLAGQQGNFPWAVNVFETLTRFDKDAVPQPLLATDWEVAEDGLSIDINLRDDVTFHTGRPMTANDVKFSFETAVTPEAASQLAFIGKQFTAIDVISDTELTITFAKPLPTVFEFFEQAFIIDQETWAGVPDGSEVVGTGPFTFESWTPGSEIRLARFDDYWGDPAYLDEIEVAIIPDSTAMVNSVRSGRAQVAIGMSGVDIQGIMSDPGFGLATASGNVYPLGVAVDVAPFDNQQVRQAVQYAIDRQRIADQVFGGLAFPSVQFWSPDTPGYDESLEDSYAYDPEKAQEMLEEAGAAGTAFEITVFGLEANVAAAEVVRNNLEAVGLKPTVKVLEQATFGPLQVDANLGTSFMPLHGQNGSGAATLIERMPSIRVENNSHFSSDEFTELRASLLSAVDQTDVEEATRAMAEFLIDEAFALPLVQYPTIAVVNNDAVDVDYTRRSYFDFSSTYLQR